MRKPLVCLVLISVATLLGGASSCDGGPSAPAASTRTACDPLATTSAKTTALGEILGIGRDADGTVYVVDSVTSQPGLRVFVAEGKKLMRRRVLASEDSNVGGSRLIVLDIEASPDTLTLALEVTASARRMAIVPGAVKASSFDELAGRRALEVLGNDFVTGFKAYDLGGEVEVEYVAKTQKGQEIVVVRPRDNWTYDDFRVFYGAPSQLLERHVTSVARAKDGGSTTINFEIDATDAIATFPVELSADGGFQPGPAKLKLGGQTLSLERLASDRSALKDVKFMCLR
jgi:hypothetical protein